jgi:hypothetical protein
VPHDADDQRVITGATLETVGEAGFGGVRVGGGVLAIKFTRANIKGSKATCSRTTVASRMPDVVLLDAQGGGGNFNHHRWKKSKTTETSMKEIGSMRLVPDLSI